MKIYSDSIIRENTDPGFFIFDKGSGFITVKYNNISDGINGTLRLFGLGENVSIVDISISLVIDGVDIDREIVKSINGNTSPTRFNMTVPPSTSIDANFNQNTFITHPIRLEFDMDRAEEILIKYNNKILELSFSVELR